MIWPKPLLGLAQPSVKAALVLSLGYVYSADNPYLFIQLFVVRTFFQYPYSGVGILVVTLTLILILILLTLTVTLKWQKLASIWRSAQHVHNMAICLTLLWCQLQGSLWAALIDGKLLILVAQQHACTVYSFLTLCEHGNSSIRMPTCSSLHITQFTHHYTLTYHIFFCALYLIHYAIPRVLVWHSPFFQTVCCYRVLYCTINKHQFDQFLSIEHTCILYDL